MPLDVQLLLLIQLASIDRCGNIMSAIAQHRQCIHVDVIIYQHDGFLGLFDQVDNVGIGIEYLAVVEDALDRRKRRADKEINLIRQICYLMFQCKNPLINYITFE